MCGLRVREGQAEGREGRVEGFPGRMGYSFCSLHFSCTGLTPSAASRPLPLARFLLSPIPGVCGVCHNSPIERQPAANPLPPPSTPITAMTYDVSRLSRRRLTLIKLAGIVVPPCLRLGRLRLHCRRKGMRAEGGRI
jgi:hypothetical protein